MNSWDSSDTYRHVDILDKLIKVFEVLMGVLELEVWTHRHHNVIGRVSSDGIKDKVFSSR